MFDPVIKDVSDRYPGQLVDVLRQILGFRASGEVEIVQASLPPGTLEADRVYRLSDPSPSLLHTEWESSSSLARPDRFHVYNTLLTRQTGLPVKTVVVLLRPEANSSDLSGELARSVPEEDPYLIWRYSVVRLWEVPAELFLQSPGMTPFAALAALRPSELPELAKRMVQQWKTVDEREARDLKAYTEIWLGLRFDRELIHTLFGEKAMIKESVIYQEILEEGLAEGRAIADARVLDRSRKAVLRVGVKNLGEPSSEQRKCIESCTDLDRLDRMLDAAVDASAWALVVITE